MEIQSFVLNFMLDFLLQSAHEPVAPCMHISAVSYITSNRYFFHKREIILKSALHMIDHILVEDPTSEIHSRICLNCFFDVFCI